MTSIHDISAGNWIPAALLRILRDTPGLERAYLVGGCVRDALLGGVVKDFDVEVYGVGYDRLERVLRRWGRVDRVGRSFGVVKLRLPDRREIDFSVPRRDSKTGPGHRGFEAELDPDLTVREAAARRDFTINAMLFDPREGRLIDEFGGRDDLMAGVLRHTSPAFSEDPLRVLRGMQFAGRFGFRGAGETLDLCRSMADAYAELPVERVREEWMKWAARSRRPSSGLEFLQASGWRVHYPELEALSVTPQDPEWHPEGDVWVHTGHCCDALADLEAWRGLDEESRVVYQMGVLCHDLGKAVTTERAVVRGRESVISPGHDAAGVPLAESFLGRIGMPRKLVDRVLPLVRHHMAHVGVEFTERAVRRLAQRLAPETIEGLTLVITADHMGRPPKPREEPGAVRTLREMADALRVRAEAPRPILMGRHLLERGWKPGPRIGMLVRRAFESQLDGEFEDLDGAFAWLARQQDAAE